MDDILIFDDILPKQHVDFLEYYYIRGENKWYFQQDITFDETQNSEKRVNHYGFANLFFDRQGKPEQGADFYNALPILYQATSKAGLEVDMIFRMRAFLQLPVVGSEEDPINNAHVDLPITHTVVLFYLTDSDGDTIIYNEREKSDTYTIKQRVTPKKGRCVVFDGSLYHSSSRPTNNKRCILNIDFNTK
jgi:hypothetical protein